MRTLALAFLIAACNVPATKFTAGAPRDASGTGDATDGGSGDAAVTQTPAMLSASPSGDVALGTVVVGQTSAESMITVSNDGDQASGVLGLSLGDMTTGFAITHDHCSTRTLAGHTTCTFGLTFTPASSAAVQTSVSATANPGGAVMKVVFGTGIAQGQIDITDASYTFPNQGLGAAAGTKVFTVRNAGQTQIGVPMPSTSGGDPSYTVKSTTCTAPLAQTGTCTVTVQFAPTSVGQKAGSLVVTSSPGGSDAASLSATAFAHVVATTSGTGTGSITSSPSGIACPGTCAADFTSSPISLTASPSATASFGGWGGDCSGTAGCSLVLNGAKNVSATFAALAPGAIDITDASYTFPNQSLGATATTKVFTVRNTGQLQTGVPMASISGSDPSYTVKSTTCTAALGPTDTCTVTVQFAPSSVGAKTNSLVVSASPGGSDTASLFGTAFAHVTVTIAGMGTGSVSSSPAGISCPGTCAADLSVSPITLTASPDAASLFAGWSGDCSGTAGCSLTLNAAKNVTASFSVNPCDACPTQEQHVVQSTCSASTCGYTACVAGYGDVDGDRTNGCESTLPTGVPEASRLVLWLAGDTGWNGTTWADQSGGGRNASLYYGTVGTASQNGKFVADFSSGGELLISSGFPNWAGLTVLAVSNTSADDELLAMGVSYNPSCSTTAPAGAPNCVAYDQLGFGAAMGLQQCDPTIGSCYQAYSPAVTLNSWVRTIAEEDPAANPSFHSYVNGTDNGVLNHNLAYPYPAPWSTPRKDTIVGWRNYRGKIAEIIVFNVPLSAASRTALDQYLATKWNVH